MQTNNVFGGLDDYANNLIQRTARRLGAAFGFNADDQEDLAREILLELLKVMPKFDPARGELKAFITYWVDKRSKRALKSMVSVNSDFQRVAYSLDETVREPDGEDVPKCDLIDSERYLMSVGVIRRQAIELTDVQLDVEKALSAMGPHERDICVRIMSSNINQVARDLGVSRRYLYENLRRLRPLFEECGLAAYI